MLKPFKNSENMACKGKWEWETPLLLFGCQIKCTFWGYWMTLQGCSKKPLQCPSNGFLCKMLVWQMNSMASSFVHDIGDEEEQARF
jgi:hypothetical protein